MYGEVYSAEKTMVANVDERHRAIRRSHLVRSLRPPHRRTLRWLRSILGGVGHRLIAWGAWLEKHGTGAARDPARFEHLEWS